MPNWCSTAYVVEGDAQEVKSLYELMNGLQERKEPSVKKRFRYDMAGVSRGRFGQRLERGKLSGLLDRPRNERRHSEIYDGNGMGALQRDIRLGMSEIPFNPLLLSDRRTGHVHL